MVSSERQPVNEGRGSPLVERGVVSIGTPPTYMGELKLIFHNDVITD
jgi:hypothetical protein